MNQQIDSPIKKSQFSLPDKFRKNKPINPNPEFHLIAAIQASLQYCFWKENSLNRPVDSTWVNNIVLKYYKQKDQIIQELKNSGITLLEERIKSIENVYKLDFEKYKKTWDKPEEALQMLLKIPGFIEDPRRKKALCAIKESTKNSFIRTNLGVPLDYRLPQVLNHLGFLKYKDSLIKKIENDVLLSLEEAENIRHNTNIICNKLSEENNCTPHEIDDYLFSLKNQCKNKHHLFLTTWY